MGLSLLTVGDIMSETWVTLAVILAGVATVIGSVLWLRLHAFLALVFGALVVAALTPPDQH